MFRLLHVHSIVRISFQQIRWLTANHRLMKGVVISEVPGIHFESAHTVLSTETSEYFECSDIRMETYFLI